MNAFVLDRSYELDPTGAKILDTSSDNFFRLSSVLAWAQGDRVKIVKQWDSLDEHLKERLACFRTEYERDERSLDRLLPPIPFDERCPASYVLMHLQRILVKEWKSRTFMPHDGRDFAHAVMAAAVGSLSTLDKHWKRRVESIPKPNKLAKIFYRPEMDRLVDELEALVKN
jgi:hypothetical protein